MRGWRTLVAGGVVAVAGLALLLLESFRALGHSSYNALATILLYGGVGLIALAGILAVVAIYRSGDGEPAPSEG